MSGGETNGGIQASRLPGLDGVRVLATFCILLSHVPQKDFCHWSVPSLPVPGLCAYTFFVLSGFLAGYKVHELKSYGSSLKSKARRLLPPYFLCIATVLLFYAILGRADEVFNRGLLYYMLLIPQVPFSQANGIVPLVHLWYIGVLVLFHLAMPLICKKNGEVRSALVCLIWLTIKYGLYLFEGSSFFLYRLVSCTAFDCLFFGVLLGMLYSKRSPVIIRVCDNRIVSLFSWGLFLSFYFYGRFIPAPVRVQFFTVLSGLLILGQLGNKVLISLDHRAFTALGRISYETYLFHIPVIIGLSLLFVKFGMPDSPLLIYTVCVALSLLAATLANRFLNLFYGNRNRIQPRR